MSTLSVPGNSLEYLGLEEIFHFEKNNDFDEMGLGPFFERTSHIRLTGAKDRIGKMEGGGKEKTEERKEMEANENHSKWHFNYKTG